MDKRTANKIIEKIFASEIFTAEIDKKIIEYLVENTIDGKNLKEVEIAKDIFGRDDNFNPSDSSLVRSHIYSIRKKLQTYYLGDGASDDYRLRLPKGHYRVEFVKNEKKYLKTKIKWQTSYYFIISTIVFFFLSIYFWERSVNHTEQYIKSTIDENNIIWKDFLISELPTLLVLGDYYVYQKPHKLNESEIFLRNVQINSSEDFEEYLKNNPELKSEYIETPLTYLGMEAPEIVSEVTKIFGKSPEKLSIKLASDLSWRDLKNNNIIFVGSEKTLRVMKFFQDKLRYKAQLFPHKVFYTPNFKDTVETFTLESYYRYGFHDDFPIIAKFPTTDKNVIMLITSFSSFGKTESLKELLSSNLTDQLIEKNFISGEIPQFFEILFKVHGVERTGFNTDIMYFHEITEKIIVKNNN